MHKPDFACVEKTWSNIFVENFLLARFTTLLLLLSCTLVTALEWIGNGKSITCIQVFFLILLGSCQTLETKTKTKGCQSPTCVSPFHCFDCPHGLFLHKHFGPLFSILDFLFFYSHSCFHLSHFSNVQEGPDDSWNIPPNVINTYCYIMWVQDTFKWKVKSKENFSQVNLHPPQAAGRWGAGRKRGRTRSRSVQPKVCIFRFVTLKKDGVNVFWWWNFSFYWYLFCNWQ